MLGCIWSEPVSVASGALTIGSDGTTVAETNASSAIVPGRTIRFYGTAKLNERN